MSTICADELLHDEGRIRTVDALAHGLRRPRIETTSAGERTPAASPARRYEDFEARSTDLGDVLGGIVFPRVV